jgi:hypothetical protein
MTDVDVEPHARIDERDANHAARLEEALIVADGEHRLAVDFVEPGLPLTIQLGDVEHVARLIVVGPDAADAHRSSVDHSSLHALQRAHDLVGADDAEVQVRAAVKRLGRPLHEQREVVEHRGLRLRLRQTRGWRLSRSKLQRPDGHDRDAPFQKRHESLARRVRPC